VVVFPSRAIIKYELVSTLRTVRSFLFVLAFVGVLLTVAVYSWPEGSRNPRDAGVASWEFVRVVTRTLFWVSLIFVPAYAAGAIVGEKERGSFDMLRLTLIRTSGIILGKLVNAAGFFLLLFASLLPVFATVLFLVGVDLYELGMACGLILATATACAMVGILSSTMFDKGIIAIAGAYVGVLALMLGPVLVSLLALLFVGLFAIRSSIGQTLQFSLMIGSPPYTLEAITHQQVSPFVFSLSMLYHAVFIGACYWLTLRVLRRPPRPVKVPAWKPIDSDRLLKQRRQEWPYYLIDPMRRKKPIEDGRNPMLVRELRYGLISHGTIWIRVFYSALLVYFLLGIAITFERTSFEDTRTWLMAQIILTVAVAPALVANALTKEYELGNIDMLRMTLLKSDDIIWGKAMAGLMAVMPLVAAAFLSAVPLMLWGLRDLHVVLMGYVTLAVCALVSLSLGLAASLVAKRTTPALIMSYALNIFVFGGLTYLAQFLYHGKLLLPRGSQIDPLVAMLSPIRAFYQFSQTLRGSDGGPDLSWLLSMFLFTLLGLALTYGSLRGFERFRMRDV
jgi:ABC-type transport system involved in multi-copper enzyme maturation permease subunit